MPDSHSDLPELIAIGEVARIFGVTVGTVRNWDRQGQLTAVRTPSGQRKFRRVDVEASLTARASA